MNSILSVFHFLKLKMDLFAKNCYSYDRMLDIRFVDRSVQ